MEARSQQKGMVERKKTIRKSERLLKFIMCVWPILVAGDKIIRYITSLPEQTRIYYRLEALYGLG
jgi:hypothetical protein